MTYFAGPIVLSPSESAALLSIFLVIFLIVIGLIGLFVWSIRKTLKTKRKQEIVSVPENRWRLKLTIILPIITIISFVIWLLASMATKEDRYLNQGALSASSVLSAITIGLFALSVCSAMYYSFKK